MVWSFVLCAFFLLRAPASAHAQIPVLRFEHLTIADGLSHSTVTAFAEYQGFLWIGTNDGLNRYDGREFLAFKHDPADPASLSHNSVTELFVDSRGRLWVGTRNGLNLRNLAGPGFTRFLHDPADPASISDNRIGTIAEDARGRLWVGTRFGGVNVYDPATNTFRALRPAGESVGGLVYKDLQGRIWLGNSAGLHLIDTEAPRLIPYIFDSADPARDVYGLAEDRDGMLWVGTDNGLYAYQIAEGRATHYRHDPADPRSLSDNGVSWVFADKRNQVWVSTYSAGLNRLDRGGGGFRRIRHDPANPTSLSTDQVGRLYLDRKDLIWIGGESGGVNIFNPETEELHHYTYDGNQPVNLSSVQVTSLVTDPGGALWVGTVGGGLNRLERGAAPLLTVYRAGPGGLADDTVSMLYFDRQGTLWVGSYDGLSALDPATGRIDTYRHDPSDPTSLSSNAINRMLEDRAGALWIGTEDGLNRFERGRGVTRIYPAAPDNPTALAGADVSALYEAPDGTLWVGTWGGGLHRLIDRERGSFARFQADPGRADTLSDNFIYQLIGDRAGGIWIATLNGLNHLDPASGRFTRYGEEQGLPANNITCVIPAEDGALWLSTGRGLARLDPTSGAVRRLTPRDGLQSYEFRGNACHQAPTGELFFGGINGFNAFFPRDLVPVIRPVQVRITGLHVLNQPTLTDELESSSLKLSYRDSLITFDYTALEFVHQHAIRYRYRLEGFDQDWIEAGDRRSATYTNLPPGRYQLLVSATDLSGRWGEPTRSVTLEVSPPPWLSWWAYLAYALAAAGTIGGYVRWRTTSAERKRRELERLVATRTRELEQANAALELRTAELRDLFEQAPVGIAVVRDGVVCSVNPAVLRMFGYDRPEEMRGSLVLEHLAPGERVAEIERVMRQARGEPSVAAREVTMLRRDGSYLPIFTHAALSASFEGEPAAISFVVDLTALKAAEAERDRFFNLAQDLLCIAGEDGYFKRLNPAWQATLGLTVEELLSEPFLTFVHPDDREATRQATRQIADTRLLSFENRYRAKDGSYRWLAWSYSWAPEQRLFYGVARDISDQKRAEAEQRRLYAIADGLREVLTVINSNRPLTEVLELIIAQATRLLGADAGVVTAVQGEGSDLSQISLRLEAVYGLNAPCRGLVLPARMSVMTCRALEERRPVVTVMAQSYAASFDNDVVVPEHRAMLEEIKARFRSLLAAPLLIDEAGYGAIVLYAAGTGGFSDEERRLATAFAAQSALAIQNARLREQVGQAAVIEERNRLARELHDAITQSLYSLTLLAEGCRFQSREAGLLPVADDFQRLGEIAQQALREMRLLIYQLRPPVLQTEGLVGAIRQRLDLVEQRAGLRARLIVEDEVALSPAAEEQVYRIVQEALNNTLKHAGAREVAVRLRRVADATPPQAEVQISDDGVGFDPDHPAGGIGLSSMRERAATLGGSVRFESGAGSGTIVVIRVPG